MMNYKEIGKILLVLFIAVGMTRFFLEEITQAKWGVKPINGILVENPQRRGRSGLQSVICTTNIATSKGRLCILFDIGGNPKHPLNTLKRDDSIIVNVRVDPKKDVHEYAEAVNLISAGKVLFSEKKYYERRRESKLLSLVLAVIAYGWLFYQLKKHYFHYRNLKSKRRFNVPV
jgi:hypothetical protein